MTITELANEYLAYYFERRYLAVGRRKTEAGEGRTIPLNSVLYEALSAYSKWYTERFGEIRPEWYVFPFGKPRPNDPTRPVTMGTGMSSRVQSSSRLTPM